MIKRSLWAVMLAACMLGPGVAHAVLVIAICGSAEYECASRDDALNSTFGKPDTAVQPGAGGAVLDVTNGSESERVPATSNELLGPAPPDAPATVAAYVTGGGVAIAATPTTEYSISSWQSSKAAACSAYVSGQPATGTGGCGNGAPKNYTYAVTSSDPSCTFTTTISYVDGGATCLGPFPQTVGYSTRVVNGCPGGYTLNGSMCEPPPPVYTCGPGYTLSGSSCNLSDARAVTADSKADFQRSGETLSTPSTADADTSIFLDNESIGKIVAGSYQRSGYSPAGNPAHIEVKPAAGGGSTVVYTESSGGTVKQISFTVGSGGSVGNVTGASGLGSLSPSTGTGTATVSGPASVAAPGSGGGTGSGLPQSTFPSDYSRSGEAAAAAQTIANKLDEKLGNGSDPAELSQPQGSEFDQAFFQGTFTNLLGWQLPAHTSQCPTSSFTFNSTSYTVDSHCQLVANHFSALSSVMSVVWTILALFILLGA